MRVGDKIKLLRSEEQWTQKELAARLKCAQSTVSDMEKGALIDTVMKVNLGKVFGKPHSYFEEETENVSIATPRMIVEDLLDTLIARGTISDPNNIDKSTIDMLVQVMKKDIEDKLKKVK